MVGGDGGSSDDRQRKSERREVIGSIVGDYSKWFPADKSSQKS